MIILEVFIIVAMVLLNGVFAAYELALASVRPERLRALVEARRPGARAALAMKERMEASLAVIQLGITLFGAVAAAVGGASVSANLAPFLERLLGCSALTAWALALALFVLPLAAVTITVGELIPKSLGIRNPEWVCLILSPCMRGFALVAFPVVWIFETATKKAMAWLGRFFPPAPLDQQTHLSELRAQVGMLRAAQVIGLQQEQIIVQAARLSTMRVRDIMLPAQDIVMLEADAPLTQNLVKAHLDLHTRFPVTTRPEDPQAIIGYVNFKEMVFLAKTHPHNPSLREITRPLLRLPADLPVSDALRRMVNEHVHLALVCDRDNQVLGLITQEDIFEELVGDIQDEFDRLPRHATPSGRQWVVGGGLPMVRLRELLSQPDLASDLPAEATVHDWLERSLGRRPRGGDVVRQGQVAALVRKVRRHKVAEALIDPTGNPIEPEVIRQAAQGGL